MVDQIMHASGSGEWQTPPALFAWADARWHFTLDAAATAENTLVRGDRRARRDVIKRGYLTAEDDGLVTPWAGNVWLNPPYGRGLLQWAEACARNNENEATRWIVALLPARTDTRTWRLVHDTASQIWLLQGRLTFKGSCGDNAPGDIIAITRSGRAVECCKRCEVRVKSSHQEGTDWGQVWEHAYDPAPFPSALVLWSHGQAGPASYQMLAKERWVE